MKGRTARRRKIWRYNDWACARRYDTYALPCVMRQCNRDARRHNARLYRTAPSHIPLPFGSGNDE